AGNALDPEMARGLAAALTDRPAGTRAVLLLGEGERFCVGGDVRFFAGAADPGAAVGGLAHDWHEVVRLLLACPVPVVAGAAAAVALGHAAAAGPLRAMVRTRALVRRAATRSLEEQLDDEARLIAESAADPEGREGVRAFLEKRTPDFRAGG